MRVVALQPDAGTATAAPTATVVLVLEPDVRRRLAGRGAWLHPTPDCFDLAIRRRAFARALRVPGPLDTTALAAAFGQHQDRQDQHD